MFYCYHLLCQLTACSEGFYGWGCLEECLCGIGSCDPVHGRCVCPVGYLGADCSHSECSERIRTILFTVCTVCNVYTRVLCVLCVMCALCVLCVLYVLCVLCMYAHCSAML